MQKAMQSDAAVFRYLLPIDYFCRIWYCHGGLNKLWTRVLRRCELSTRILKMLESRIGVWSGTRKCNKATFLTFLNSVTAILSRLWNSVIFSSVPFRPSHRLPHARSLVELMHVKIILMCVFRQIHLFLSYLSISTAWRWEVDEAHSFVPAWFHKPWCRAQVSTCHWHNPGWERVQTRSSFQARVLVQAMGMDGKRKYSLHLPIHAARIGRS